MSTRQQPPARRPASQRGTPQRRQAPPPSHGRRRLAVAGLGVVIVVVVGVMLFGGGGDPPREQQRAERFVSAWIDGDYGSMYEELSDAAKARTSPKEFRDAYRRDAGLATLRSMRIAGKTGEQRDGTVAVPTIATTRVFGTVRAPLVIPFDPEGGADPAIDWRGNLTFPGVPRGRKLERSTEMPARADLLARDGTPLAEGEGRTSPLGPAASAITGQLGKIPKEQADELRGLGYPKDAKVGLTGLERIFDERLSGSPGGTLRAGGDVLARVQARKGRNVRTTIDPKVQSAAVEGLAGRVGGVAAMKPRTGEILALAGVAFSGLQPPGSTFKIITLASALESRKAGPNSTYPVQTKTEIEGVEIENANGESCGGTLRYSFAHSCNSVFAPLGAEVGASKLVETAEAFGFNKDPGIPGAATSTIPEASEIGDRLAVGSSAIGQGRVQATALQMSWVASTIADRGRRPGLTLDLAAKTTRTRAIDAGVARQVGDYMLAVVDEGTGGSAKISGVRVAGKTGTAELKDTSTPDCTPAEGVSCPPVVDDLTDTDAWFSAYAPAGQPKIAVGVLLVQMGTGGEFAAPVAKTVLQAGL